MTTAVSVSAYLEASGLTFSPEEAMAINMINAGHGALNRARADYALPIMFVFMEQIEKNRHWAQAAIELTKVSFKRLGAGLGSDQELATTLDIFKKCVDIIFSQCSNQPHRIQRLDCDVATGLTSVSGNNKHFFSAGSYFVERARPLYANLSPLGEAPIVPEFSIVGRFPAPAECTPVK